MAEQQISGKAGGSQITASVFWIFLLAALSALGQFATNIYLPSLPEIRAQFDATDALAQTTLSAYLISFAVMQLFYGPVSDKYGRRPLIIFGAVIYIAGSAYCMFAPTLEHLIFARVMQAFGAACTLVVSRAVIRDSFDGTDLQRVMTLTAMVFALVPGLSPLMGGIVSDLAGWRNTFLVAGFLGVIVLALVLWRLPETLPRDNVKVRSIGDLVKGYVEVLSSRRFRRYALAGAFAMGGIFAFFGASPKIFIEILGVSPTEYGFYPPLASTGFIIGGAIVGRLIHRMTPQTISGIGLAFFGIGVAIILFFSVFGPMTKYTLTLGVVVYVTGLGIFFPTAMAMAVMDFPHRAGTASAAMGFMQMGMAAVGAHLVGMLQAAKPVMSMPIVMGVMASLALIIFFSHRRTV